MLKRSLVITLFLVVSWLTVHVCIRSWERPEYRSGPALDNKAPVLRLLDAADVPRLLLDGNADFPALLYFLLDPSDRAVEHLDACAGVIGSGRPPRGWRIILPAIPGRDTLVERWKGLPLYFDLTGEAFLHYEIRLAATVVAVDEVGLVRAVWRPPLPPPATLFREYHELISR
jgi:hypothetical protein